MYEMLGRKQAALEEQDVNYTQLLNLTAGLVRGDVDPGRVLINLTARSWSLCPPGERQGLPATINGLPVCVVAPPPPAAPAPEPDISEALAHPEPHPNGDGQGPVLLQRLG